MKCLDFSNYRVKKEENWDSVLIRTRVESCKKILKNHLGQDPRFNSYIEQLNEVDEFCDRFTVPQIDGSVIYYYRLNTNVGGVTEKVCFIRENGLLKVLDEIENSNFPTRNILFPNEERAIIKLIKKNKLGFENISELISEAIALDLARVFGFLENTADSLMVTYENKPALFVPFDDIHLLKDIVAGHHEHHYEVDSLVKAVGEGIMPNIFIEDLGKYFGYIFLCNDPDCIGGYNQNKGLTAKNRLYIFDQTIRDNTRLHLDASFNLEPSFLARYSRHTKGRNYSVLFDASIEAKINSLLELKDKRESLLEYCSSLENLYLEREHEMDHLYENYFILCIKRINIIKNAIERRISEIENLLHRFPDTEARIGMIIFEQWFNSPVRFSKIDGRPYRNLWTDEHINYIKKYELENNGEQLGFKLEFLKNISEREFLMVQKCLGRDVCLISEKQIWISNEALENIKNLSYYPEEVISIDLFEDYLDANDIQQLAKNYDINNEILDKILELVNRYKSLFLLEDFTKITQKVFQIVPHNHGFANHILKKMHFDLQQKLYKIFAEKFMDSNLQENLYKCFIVAAKLDRIGIYNKWLINVASNGLDLDEFIQKLKYLQSFDDDSLNHFKAIEHSEQFAEQLAIFLNLDEKISLDCL